MFDALQRYKPQQKEKRLAGVRRFDELFGKLEYDVKETVASHQSWWNRVRTVENA